MNEETVYVSPLTGHIGSEAAYEDTFACMEGLHWLASQRFGYHMTFEVGPDRYSADELRRVFCVAMEAFCLANHIQ